jgi:hypothetical protein
MISRKAYFLLTFVLGFMISFATMGQEKVETGDDQSKLNEALKIEKEALPVVRYSIEAQLLPESKKLTGSEILTWTNTSEKAVEELRFHLYYNAFRNEKTTFFRESRFYKKTPDQLSKLQFGEIKIKKMEIIGGELLTQKIRYISPDDNNEHDRTVIEVSLEKPIDSGETIKCKIEFSLTIPEIFARTGQVEDYFFLGQWFPKIGVLQLDGTWNCHQFHRNTNFFANFGEYNVIITLPERFIIGATGNLVKKVKNTDGTTTHFFKERNIHDFAWVAYPDFIKVIDKIKLDGNNHDTMIELLLAPGHENARERFLESLKFSLQFFSKHIFPYPYKKITLVDPPFKSRASGGMEYPTLITTMHFNIVPNSIKLLEMVTIHEFGHQYWYGIVANDEFREAWLDEGITTFFELEMMDEYFKHRASLIDSKIIKIDDWEMSRMRYSSILPVDRVNQYSWMFLNGSQYGNNVYAKVGIFLRSLKNLVGKEKLYSFFKFYAKGFMYKHPTSTDFIQAFNTFMAEDFSWAFNQFINGDRKLDFSVHSVESFKIRSDPDNYRNEVVFLRNEGYFPVDLLIKLRDQREIKSFWKDNKKWKKIIFHESSPIDYAAIDPEFKIPLDTNFLNNSMMLKPNKSFIKRLSLKFGFFFQNLMGFLIF